MKFVPGILLVLVVALAGASMVDGSGAAFSSTSSAPRNTVSSAADWTAPTISVANPGSPLRGTVTVSATAADAHGTISSVRLQRSAAVAGQWTDICTRTATPYSCSWNTVAAGDSSYDLRAIATDNSANAATSAVIASRVVDNTAPVVAMADPGSYLRGTVSLEATATDARTGVTSVAIQRSIAYANSWTTICTVTAAPYTCSLNTRAGATADNDYDFRAIATDGAGNTGSDTAGATIDNTAPATTLTVPGAPLRGVVTFAASPSDAGSYASGVVEVTIQVSPAGAANWTAACAASSSPWSCSWNSTAVTMGSYDFRALVTDAAGNTGVSGTTTRTVDNSVSSVFMDDPGSFLRSTVTLQATVSNPANSPSVNIQISSSGANSWTTLCTVTATPWSCPFDSTTRADGLYDLRAVLTDASGTKTSNTVTSRVDNTLLRGTDVQSANKAGGIAGRIETGDTLALSYSELVAPGSLAAGFTGASRSILVRLRDAGVIGSSGRNDTIDFLDTAGKSTVNLGSINAKSDMIKGGKTAIYNATLITTGSAATTATITIGTLASGGGVRTSSDNVAMLWTPSAGATDAAGNVCSTAPVTQSGALHVNL